MIVVKNIFFFFSSRRRHTRCSRDWNSDVCSSDLAPRTPKEERETEWNGSQRVAEVVDQIREQGDAQRARVDERLCKRRDRENGETDRDGLDPSARTQDGTIDESVRMPLFTRIMVIVVGERFRMVVRATKITCGGMG